MTIPDFEDLNHALVPLAIEAGRLILEYYNTDLLIVTKSDNSPVTEADGAAEKLILEGLAANWPEITVVAEEMCASGTIPEAESCFFLVDPLDGTKEFIKKRDEFTVNIALIVNGSPYYGIVFAPALGELFICFDEKKAGYLQLNLEDLGKDGSTLPFKPEDFSSISVRPWQKGDLIAVTSRSHLDEKTSDFLNKNNIEQRIPSGSSLKFCKIAKGTADIYPRFAPTMEWDTAAGHAVLLAAGGVMIDEKGEPFRYGKYDARYLNGHFIAGSKTMINSITL